MIVDGAVGRSVMISFLAENITVNEDVMRDCVGAARSLSSLAATVEGWRRLSRAQSVMMNAKANRRTRFGLDRSIVVLNANDLSIVATQITSVRVRAAFKKSSLRIARFHQMWSHTVLVERPRCLLYLMYLDQIARLLFLIARRNARKSSHAVICANRLVTRANADCVSKLSKSPVVVVEPLPRHFVTRVWKNLHLACASAELL